MMRQRAGRRPVGLMGQINLTPMVDVMLVVLIVFMVVTPAIVAGFQVSLPQGRHLLERPERVGQVVLGIDRAGTYYLNAAPIDRAMAGEILARELASRTSDRVVFIKADRHLRYGEVREAMQIARAAGAVAIAAVTEQETGANATTGRSRPR